jgi:hypothetical protein
MKFERVFTDHEYRIRHRIKTRYGARRRRAKVIEYTRRYRLERPDKLSTWHRNERQKLSDSFVAAMLRRRGDPVTPESIKSKRRQVRAHRALKLLRLIYATSQIANQG